MDCVLLGNGGW
ncbi:unnamed protein product, partial [Rotaria sp. Silwood1]